MTRATQRPTQGPGESLTSDQQIFVPLPEAVRKQTLTEFQRRNGASWNIRNPGGSADINAFTGKVWALENRSPVGAPVDVTAPEARTLAQAFLEKNKDLLGLTDRDLQFSDVHVEEEVPRSPTLNIAYRVFFEGQRHRAGFEDFENINMPFELQVMIRTDGEVRSYHTGAKAFPPELTLDTRPNLAPTDPRVLGKVLGQELIRYEETVKPGEFGVFYIAQPLGKAEAGDIESVRKVLHESIHHGAPTQLKYTLAYEIVASRKGHDSKFVIDAGTGEVIERPLPPGPILGDRPYPEDPNPFLFPSVFESSFEP
jgi:hypothetical protein